MMRGLTIASTLALLASAVLTAPAVAQESEKLLHNSWSFNGPFGHYDRASAQRGLQVYKQVCATCHSMNLVYYRDLRSLGLTDDQVKAFAADVQIAGGTNDAGEPVDRPGLPADHFKAPYANEKAARASNGGALPPDQSLLVKARENGPDYIYSLLQGYEEAPKGVTVPAGQYYNKYFPGHLLAMPQPLQPDQVEYSDGTKATLEQEAKDIVQFLTWASEPTMEARKQMGVKAVLFLALLTGLTYVVKKKVWKDVH